MSVDRPPFAEISGFLGVGSLEILGVFFILDGTSGFLAFIERYARTSTWAILVAVPLLVVAYVFGLVSSLAAGMVIERVAPSRLTPALFRAVCASGNEALLARYTEAERHTLLLDGCAVAFALLGAGSWAEVGMMGSFGFVGYVGLAGGLGVAVLCPVIARQLQRRVVALTEAVTGADDLGASGATGGA